MMYRIHLKIIKNKIIKSLLQYPIIVLAGGLLISIILVLTFRLYVNFVTQVDGFLSSIDDTVITKITRSYMNILFISSILLPCVLNTFYEGKDRIIEIIYALPYDSNKIRKIWNMPMNSLIFVLTLFLLTPYSLYIIRLNNINIKYTLYVLFIQYIYILCCIIFSYIMTKLIKIILYKYINVKSQYKLSIYIVIVSDIFILLVILLFNSNAFNKYIPTQFIMNTIYIIKHFSIIEFVFNIIFNFASISIMMFLYLTISRIKNINTGNIYISEIGNNIKINENRIMVYIRLLTKKITRNKEGLAGIISMFFIIVVVGYLVSSSDMFSISVPQLYSFNVYFVYMLLGIYIISFDDMDVIQCIKNYNGNIRLYNLIYILENSFVILLFYFIEDIALCLLCGINITTIFSVSKLNIFMFTAIAMLFKNLFLNKDSSKIMQFVSIYGFVISITIIGYIGAKLSPIMSIMLNNNNTVANAILIVIFTIIFYFLQFVILKIKEIKYV